MGKKNQSCASFMTLGYDKIWTLPSYEHTLEWQHTMFRSIVHTVPYVWDSMFFDTYENIWPKSQPKYASRGKRGKVVMVLEPNLFIVKTAIVPLAIVEQVYRTQPEILESFICGNTRHWADAHGNVTNSEALSYLNALDIFHDKKMSLVGRFKIPYALSELADVVISHQWNNALNFLYFDALHARYPLVHNSPFLADCGYYYELNDVIAGAEALRFAMTRVKMKINYTIPTHVSIAA